MSKYSFIEAELNIPGKQCFCVDINNSNTQFTYATQVTNMINPVTTNPVTTNPVTTNPVTTKPVTTKQIMNTTSNNSFLESKIVNNNSPVDNTFLLSPQVKENIGEKEKQIINTVNYLLSNTVNNLENKSNVIASNEIINNIPNSSLTIDNEPTVASNIDLNKMANSKKNYRSKSNIDLFENFEQDKCNNTCSIKKKHRKRGKSVLNNDYIIIIIIILLLGYSYLQNKK